MKMPTSASRPRVPGKGRGWLPAAALCVLCAAPPPTGATDASEPLENILRSVRTLLKTKVASLADQDTRIRVDPIDARLRLARCDHDLIAELAPGARVPGNTTVNVRCLEPVRWSVFVPARVEQFAPVLVAARSLARGQRIEADDLRLERRNLSELASGYFTDAGRVAGLLTKRALSAGQVLSDALVMPAMLVERGQLVRLLVETGGLRVSMTGEALEDGALGQRVRVRNRASQRIVEGTVEAPGIVRVPL